MEKTVNAQPSTRPTGSTIKELLSIIKDGEIKDSILSLKVFKGIEFSKDKETQTSVIYLYGKRGGTKKETISESKVNSIIKDITGKNLPSYLMEANKKVLPIMKFSVPYSNLNSIFIDTVQKYLTANKLIVTSVRQDSDNNFIVMFSNRNTDNQFLSSFIKEVREYKEYTSIDARNINVARSLTNTEIKQIVDFLNKKLSLIKKDMLLDTKVRRIFGRKFLDSYKITFSIDSFIKKTKNDYSESAIRNEALKLQEEKVKTQNLKVDPPFKKWTSGDTKELPKQKKVSTLPVELEVKVQISEKKDLIPRKTHSKNISNGSDSLLTVNKLRALRNYFVLYAQDYKFSIRTKNNNNNLFNDLPVVIGNGKDKYIKVDQRGINGLFTIEAALGEQSILTKGANALYKHKDSFLTHGDNSTVQL